MNHMIYAIYYQFIYTINSLRSTKRRRRRIATVMSSKKAKKSRKVLADAIRAHATQVQQIGQLREAVELEEHLGYDISHISTLEWGCLVHEAIQPASWRSLKPGEDEAAAEEEAGAGAAKPEEEAAAAAAAAPLSAALSPIHYKFAQVLLSVRLVYSLSFLTLRRLRRHERWYRADVAGERLVSSGTTWSGTFVPS